MILSRDQRRVLGQLSRIVYGTESKWEKFYNAGRFDRWRETGEEVEPEYLAIPGRRQGAYTLISVETAKRKGLVAKDIVLDKKKAGERVKPSYEDIRDALINLCQSTSLAFFTENQRNLYFSAALFMGNLKYSLKFKKVEDKDLKEGEETYQQKIEKLLSGPAFTPEQKEKLKLIADSTEEKALEVDGTDFLIAAKTVALEPDQTTNEITDAFEFGYAQMARNQKMQGSQLSASVARQSQERSRRKANDLRRSGPNQRNTKGPQPLARSGISTPEPGPENATEASASAV